MLNRCAIVALSLSIVIGIIVFGYALGPGATVAAEPALSSKAYLPFAARNLAPENMVLSGTVTVDSMALRSDSTLETIGDTIINSRGDVSIAGSILTDGGSLTINAAGDVRITGVITPTIVTPTATMSGNVEISGRSITIEASDPGRVIIQSLASITLWTTPPVTGPQYLQQIPGTVYISGSITAGNGMSDVEQSPVLTSTVSMAVNNPGTTVEPQRVQGGSVHIRAPAVVAPRTEIRAGDGGNGKDRAATGRPSCPGTDATATGGDAGDGGRIRIGFASNSDDVFYQVVVGGTLSAGKGGEGGDAIVVPGDGDGPGCDGGNGSATGGAGGNGGDILLPPNSVMLTGSYLWRGRGANGGNAEGKGGNGATGSYEGSENGTGGAGGNFNLQSGRGGEGVSGGNGGLVISGALFSNEGAGNGGAGADGCAANPKRGGGSGGQGGALTLRLGPSGSNPSSYAWISVRFSANGGNGGPGTTGGPGGPAGSLDTGGRQTTPSDSLLPGAKGPDGCPVAAITPVVAESMTIRTIELTAFPPSTTVTARFLHDGVLQFTADLEVDENGHYIGQHRIYTCQDKVLVVEFVDKDGRVLFRLEITSYKSSDPSLCPQ